MATTRITPGIAPPRDAVSVAVVDGEAVRTTMESTGMVGRVDSTPAVRTEGRITPG
ncbi:hypothetical protein [Nocardia sp. NPDC051750]|uniref:hypothetical protein n=1 Tax=Nocardia sp. NPDC051750 TaxID=3364325 RepID=UPI0037B035E9